MGRRKGTGRIISRKTIQVDGFEVDVVRKNISSTRLKVSEDTATVQVTAPPYVPQAVIEKMVREKRSWIENTQARMAASPRAIAAEATPEQQQAWKEVVSACTEALVETWEPIMGVKARKLVYRNMKSRWGSCQPSTGRICINIRLALYPPECLEYVVVHELCHLLEANHGPQFHALMDTFMPDWKQRRAKLR